MGDGGESTNGKETMEAFGIIGMSFGVFGLIAFINLQEVSKELAELKRSLPPEAVSDYVLKDSSGEVRLSDLFGDHDDLLVVHNMGQWCAYCTMWADGFIGLLPHLLDRTAFVVVSPDDPAVQAEFAESRGWSFAMVSAAGSDFTRAMGFEWEKDGQAMVMPGYSTFRKRDDGCVVRIAQDFFGPGDVYCGVWAMLAHLDGGAGGWMPKFEY